MATDHPRSSRTVLPMRRVVPISTGRDEVSRSRPMKVPLVEPRSSTTQPPPWSGRGRCGSVGPTRSRRRARGASGLRPMSSPPLRNGSVVPVRGPSVTTSGWVLPRRDRWPQRGGGGAVGYGRRVDRRRLPAHQLRQQYVIYQ